MSSAAAASPSPITCPTYAYNGLAGADQTTDTAPERGPPAACDWATTCNAVDAPSHGADVRPHGPLLRFAGAYDDPAGLMQVAGVTATAPERVGVNHGDLSSLLSAGVAANAGARACRTNSFTGDTLVLMADGTRKPIRDVELGDMVLATDPETGDSGPRKVVDLIRHGGAHTMVAVRLADGTTIDATDGHPFWVDSRDEWVDAIDLRRGDVVVAADGRRLTVSGAGFSEQDLTAYNLTVEDLHTYFAGESSVLVHNAGCTNIADLPASAVRNLTEDSGYAFSRLSQNHGVTRVEFREQIHMIKRQENLPADFNLSFGPTGDVWNPRTGELIGSIVRGGR